MNGDGIFILLWGGHLLSNILFKDKTDEIITTFEIYMTGPSLSLSHISWYYTLHCSANKYFWRLDESKETKRHECRLTTWKKKTFSPKLLRCWIKGSRPSSNSWLHGKINQQNKFYELVCVCVPLKETRDDCLLFSSSIRDEKNKTPRFERWTRTSLSRIYPLIYIHYNNIRDSREANQREPRARQ